MMAAPYFRNQAAKIFLSQQHFTHFPSYIKYKNIVPPPLGWEPFFSCSSFSSHEDFENGQLLKKWLKASDSKTNTMGSLALAALWLLPEHLLTSS